MSCFCQVHFADIEFYEKCGSGTSGCVYRALWKSQDLIVAVKKVLAFNTEADVLNLLSHRNIIQFYGIVSESPNFCLVTEYADNGSLFDFLKLPQSDELNFEQTLQWAEDIGRGMNYLHVEAPDKLIHRDLKSKNVVIDQYFTCKICDFGASRFHESTTLMSVQGTYPWMAPEMIQRLPVSEACDVWSYGVVLWELLTHKIPFDGLSSYRIMWLVVEEHERLAVPSSCPEKFRDLLEKCWRTDPKERPSFKEILLLLNSMLNDGDLQCETNSCFGDRSSWSKEIDAWIGRIKEIERNLETWEQQLRNREMWVREKERKLQEHFKIVEVLSHDVNSWRDVDVQQWIIELAHDGRHNLDLEQLAELFVEHCINGNRLLKLTRENLRDMGITSVGHIKELLEAIEELNVHNARLINFPPLSAALQTKDLSEMYSRTIILIIGCHLRLGMSPQETKWKMYLEIDGDDKEPEDYDYSLTSLIKQVLFTSSHLPSTSFRVVQSPYIMDQWVNFNNETQKISIRCVVDYEDMVRRPRNSKIDYHINLSDTISSLAPVQVRVTLSVAPRGTTSNISPVMSGARIVSPVSGTRMMHSESSPMIRNAWSFRNLESSIPAIDTKQYQEHKWTGVVTQTEKPEFPAYHPRFPQTVPPIPPAYSRSDASSNSKPLNPIFQISSSSSPNSVHSIDSNQDSDFVGTTLRTPSMRHCKTAAGDLSRGVSREISNDSGGVFSSPTSVSTASPIDLAAPYGADRLRKLAVPPTMAEISRRLLSGDDDCFSPVGRKTPDDVGIVFETPELDSPSDVVENDFLRRSGDWRRASVPDQQSGVNQPRFDNRYPRSESARASSRRRRSRVTNSGATEAAEQKNSLVTSVKSYEVHGGNAKWTWK